jgi:hypothetical protein
VYTFECRIERENVHELFMKAPPALKNIALRVLQCHVAGFALPPGFQKYSTEVRPSAEKAGGKEERCQRSIDIIALAML